MMATTTSATCDESVFSSACFPSLYRENSRIDPRGLDRDRLLPLLAGLREILPWLHQWYKQENMQEIAPSDDHVALLLECMKRLGLSESELAAWRPPKPKRGRPPKVKPTICE